MSAEAPGASSTDLLRRAQAGDTTALAALLELYLPKLRRWATGRMPSRARDALDTDDVIQDTVIAAARRLHTFDMRGTGAFQAYLRKALANRFIDLHRHHLRAPDRDALDSQLPAASPSPLELAIGAETLARYDEGLTRLTERERQAVILRVELCCGYEEIADAIAASGPGHARVILCRALLHLAEEMRRGRS